MSWRDDVSAEAQSDLDTLASQAPGFAAHQLTQVGEFFPYAAHITLDGTVGLMSADPELLGENPTSTAVIETLEDVLGVNNAQLRASAVVYDVNTVGGEAVAVNLEHREGVALRLVIPYTRGADGVQLGDPAGVEPIEAIVFR